jgi:Cu/Ag efflux pump CusA
MNTQSIAGLVPVLQTAIGPVILISGVGLLLLLMTNRLGRIIDRARSLAAARANAPVEARAPIEAQLRILWRRSRLIQAAIALAATSDLAAALLVITLFFTALLQVETAGLVVALFSLCLACLIGSLVVFIRDINLSLAALKLELKLE